MQAAGAPGGSVEAVAAAAGVGHLLFLLVTLTGRPSLDDAPSAS